MLRELPHGLPKLPPEALEPQELALGDAAAVVAVLGWAPNLPTPTCD